jgi:uncharacterized protein with ParB-like and HNH nuclease domain
MPIEQLKVREIVDNAVGKKLDIPEFQREFVWDPEQAKFLVESLYRDYPVGSFLLWDSSSYVEPKIAEGAQISLWIVDGQQRTTALGITLASLLPSANSLIPLFVLNDTWSSDGFDIKRALLVPACKP